MRQVQRGPQGHKVGKGWLAPLAQQERPERKASKERRGPLVQPEQLVQLQPFPDPPGLLERQGRKGCKGYKGRLVPRVQLGRQARLVRKEHKASKAFKAYKASKARQARQARQERKVSKVSRGLQGLQERIPWLLVRLAQLGLRVRACTPTQTSSTTGTSECL